MHFSRGFLNSILRGESCNSCLNRVQRNIHQVENGKRSSQSSIRLWPELPPHVKMKEKIKRIQHKHPEKQHCIVLHKRLVEETFHSFFHIKSPRSANRRR